jgi:hypothetical protein
MARLWQPRRGMADAPSATQRPPAQTAQAIAADEFGPPGVGLAVPTLPSILSAIRIVRRETVIRWHRRGFRAYWRWKSRPGVGRPPIDGEIRDLIRQMSMANPLWGAPRIHGELLMLGIEVAQSTKAKYMVPRSRRPPSQNWKTFLRNHAAGIASIDLFVVPTAFFQIALGWAAYTITTSGFEFSVSTMANRQKNR